MQFQVKESFESRLFSITGLKNLDLVQSDLSEAKEHCIKLPIVSFVIFYDKMHARSLKGEDEEPKASWREEEIRLREKLFREEAEEEKAFRKLRDGLITIFQSMGPSNRQTFESLRKVEVQKMSSI